MNRNLNPEEFGPKVIPPDEEDLARAFELEQEKAKQPKLLDTHEYEERGR